MAEERRAVLTVRARAERQVVCRRLTPPTIVVLQERPVLGVVVLIGGEQVEHGAHELALAYCRAFTEHLACLDQVFVIQRRRAEVGVEQAAETMHVEATTGGCAIESS